MIKRISWNIIGQLVAFACSLGISFFLSPFVVNNLGTEVYGFVNLANTFTSYISLFTVAITSMLSRYVTIEYSKKNFDGASQYFSSALITQGILAAIILLPALFLTYNLESVVNISTTYVFDVKILWGLIFLSFLISLPGGCLSVGSFASNRLDLKSIVTVVSNLTRVIILVITFVIFTPHVWYVGLATICSEIITICGDYILKKKQTPEICLSVKSFRKENIYDLVIVGVWNSISRLNQILTTGLDLILTNLFINGYEMGILSIAKSVPAQLGNLSGSIYAAFEPGMTIEYANENKQSFANTTRYAMKLNGFLCAVPIIGFTCFGKAFYSLWMSSLTETEVNKVFLLAILTLLPQIFEIYIQPLYAVNTITKRIKLPVIINLFAGILNVLIVFTLLNISQLGVYAIASVSSIIGIIKIFTFYPLYAAKSVGINWRSFYLPLIKGVINTFALIILFEIVLINITIATWTKLIIVALCCGAGGYILSFFIIFDNQEKNKLFAMLKNRMLKN